MNNDFIKVDLHIHTPASKCFTGGDNNEEYLNILRKAKSLNIKIISITDHNSIEGYKRLINIKDSLIKEINDLTVTNIANNTHPDLAFLNKKLDLFNDLLILPGIEFETKNGVHLLIIFDNHTPLDEIYRFLEEGGYDRTQYGIERPTILSKWDILDLFAESKKHDCLVIDAHTDSDKGIYNTIQKGAYRANCFKSSQLHGVCYKSEKQKNHIITAINNSKEYQRSSILAFLKFSDAHSANEIGRNLSWFKIETIDFQSLKSAFSNPPENITTEPPHINAILNKLIGGKGIITYGIPSLSKEHKEEFKRAICALNNCKGGYILFGIDHDKNKVGLDLPSSKAKREERIKEYSTDIFNCLDDIAGALGTPSCRLYPLQANKCVISVNIKQRDKLISINNDGKIYLLNNSEIVVASATQIQDIVEERVTSNYHKYVGRKIITIEKQCSLINSYFNSMPIIKTFESKAINLGNIISNPNFIKETKFKFEDEVQLKKALDKHPNGSKTGNLLFLEEERIRPRLSYAFLRFSPPIISLKSLGNSTRRDTIYLVPGGAVFYHKDQLHLFTNNQSAALSFHPSNPQYSAKFIAAFLKSSFLLWYCINKFDNTDIFRPRIFKLLLSPALDKSPSTKAIIKHLESTSDKIISLETKFLTAKHQSIDDVNSHNRMVENLFQEIDDSIYRVIGLSEQDIVTIETCLRANDIYLPKPNK